jgi:RHS repeat-associated protein
MVWTCILLPSRSAARLAASLVVTRSSLLSAGQESQKARAGQIDSMMEGAGGHLTRAFVYLNGVSLVEYYNNTTYFIHTDHLGSTRLITNYPTPTPPAESDDYYPFGESSSSGLVPLKFTGKERDTESSLDNFGARYYSTGMGRFTTPDWAATVTPVPFADFGNPQSLNLYAYVKNNPVTIGDRDGHCGEPITFTICAGVVVLGIEAIYNHFHVLHAKAESARAAKEFEQACASSPQCDATTVHQQYLSALRDAGEEGTEAGLTTVPIVAPPNGVEEIIHEAGAGLAKDAAVEATKPKETQQQEKQPKENQQQPETQKQGQQEQKPPQQSNQPLPPSPTAPQHCKGAPTCP